MIRVEHLRKVYTQGEYQTVALDDVSLTINKGDYVAVVGPSGSGKSTFMTLIGLLDKPSDGHYYLDEMNVTALSVEQTAKVRNQRLGFVFQSFHLLPRMNALENVMLPLTYADVPVSQRKELAMNVLTRVGLADRWHHLPTQLSGGQNQRVAIARALVNSPSLLLADEPTGALDSRTGEEIMQLFESLQASGLTIVIVTHDHHVAERAHRRIEFCDGKIISDSKSRSLQPEHV